MLGEALGQPIAYAQLADALRVNLGDRVPLGRVRESVLALRASKGMVLDPDDPDTVSAGSFFTNPIVAERVARTLPGDARAGTSSPSSPTRSPRSRAAGRSRRSTEFLAHQESLAASDGDGCRTRRAAREALGRVAHRALGHPTRIRRCRARARRSRRSTPSRSRTAAGRRPRRSPSSRAIVQGRVQSEFGIILQPEPVLVGVEL